LHFGTPDQRIELPKVEIPIGLRWLPAGSGTADFRSPDGVRNSKRLRKVSFRVS
ncbi:MAG: hypothetical protein JWO15_117, partial [Sphingomonadales bacterium]|nr:hypothetical protein [Sphingomonadales bacterium]